MCWGLGLSSLVHITEMRGSGYGHEVYVREEEVEQAPGFDAAKVGSRAHVWRSPTIIPQLLLALINFASG